MKNDRYEPENAISGEFDGNGFFTYKAQSGKDSLINARQHIERKRKKGFKKLPSNQAKKKKLK